MKTKLLLMLAAVGLMAGVAGANMLTNPGFEDNLTGWHHWWIDYPAQHQLISDTGGGAHSGNKYVKMYNWIPYGSDSTAYLGQSVLDVKEDKDYSFSVWAKNEAAGQTNQAGIWVEWYSTSVFLTTGATGLISSSGTSAAVTSENWTEIDFGSFTAPYRTIAATVWLVAPLYNEDRPILCDDAVMFGATSDPNMPDVDAGPDMITWSGQEVPLDASVTEKEEGDWMNLTYNYFWSADPNEGVVFNPNEFVKDPTITITKTSEVPSVVVVTLRVRAEGRESISFRNKMKIDMYSDACQATYVVMKKPTDIRIKPNATACKTTIHDLRYMASTWLDDITLTLPIARPEE